MRDALLFRPEIMAARHEERLGSIRLEPPSAGWVFFGGAIAVVVAILTFLLAGHYTRHEHVTGTLVPSSGLLTITPVGPGVVTYLHVSEGQIVHKGQPLVEVSGEQHSATVGDTDATIAAQLKIKQSRLQSDLQQQRQLALFQQSELHERLVLLNAQVEQVDQQIAVQRDRTQSSNELYEEWKKWSTNGIVSKLQVIQQHDTALQNFAQLKELTAQELQLRQQREQLKGQLDELPEIVMGKVNDTERQLADVAQSLAQNAERRTIVLRAPEDGTVVNVVVNQGQAVSAQQPVMMIVPSQSNLRAELWVPTSAIGFIHTGQSVVLRYQAFPYQKFGQHIGRVLEVSRSALTASDVSHLLGEDVRDPRYRVEVALDRQNVLAYGRAESLRPGMTLDADVLLDRRRLIEWVIEPLYGFHANP